ncbi:MULTISPECIES: LytR/AlgR family response regulator transcription factor [Bacillus]|uniref:LytR/AlgR family response regulator transcription factor n=1 Tax=Bacillus TaxID=1386 RepID=UPI0002EF0C79|nr:MULTISPECIES: LytTR family transcriptional regulator DNA-binding domain-containing protein [Bacillus]
MLRAFIVDDEPLARDELAYLLKRSREVDIVGEADHIEDVLEQVIEQDIDVLFLDIELAGGNGLELAERLREHTDVPEIVFATAYDEYALKAFELSAFDYILKPFEENRVKQTIVKLKHKMNDKKSRTQEFVQVLNQKKEIKDKLAINLDDRIVLVNMKDIVYCTTEEGNTIITTLSERFAATESLVTFERKLQDTSIIRVHRSYLVNTEYIKEIQPWFNSTYNLIMQEGTSIPVSRTYTKELRAKIGL